MNKITIVVPIYNVEEYVSKCLESLTNQSFKEYEIWAVDDGSPDNSKDIVKQFMKKNDNIKLIEKENGGYGSVLEYAISNIKTEYFLICDPDDWLPNDALSTLYKEANSKKLDIVIADKYNAYIGVNTYEYQTSFPNNYFNIKPNVVYEGQDVYKFAVAQVSPHAKIYRTAICKKIFFEKNVSHTDYTLYIVALSNCKKIEYLNVPLAYYLNDRPGNTVTEYSMKKINSYVKVWNSTFNQIKDKNGYILFSFFLQFKSMLSEYALMEKGKYYEVKESFEKIATKLILYKKNILEVSTEKKIKKIECKLLLNRLLYKRSIKAFILLKKWRNKNLWNNMII